MKYLLTILILFFNLLQVNSQEFLQGNLAEDILFKGIPVRVTPVKKITTSKASLKVGDEVNFITTRDVYENNVLVIKRDSKVKGKVLSIIPNKFNALQAKITLGEFETYDVFGDLIPLIGEIKKEGNPHYTLISYLDFLAWFVRGGEVQMIPEDDYYILYY